MNKREARLWAQDATRTRAEHEDMLMNEWGFSPPVAWTDARIRQEVLNRIRDSRWRWRSTWTPPGWTPPPGGVVQNWPLAVLVTAAGLAILLGVAIGAMWLASDPFGDDESTTPAQPTVQPTAAPTTATTQQPPATGTAVPPASTSTVTPGGTTSSDPQAAHFARLKSLDPVFRTSGIDAWLNAAGVTWSNIQYDARQIEEETSPDSQIVAAGIQVTGTNIVIKWPVIVTTDDPGSITTTTETVQHKPDQRNPSVLYTNVVLNGKGTIWIDASNWNQFTSRLGFVNNGSQPASASATAAAQTTTTIKSIDDLKSLGTLVQVLTADGYIAGAQVRLDKDFTAPQGFVVQRQGSEVSSAKAGDTVSIWVPQALRVKQ